MGRFVNTATGVTFSVDDSKDDRYVDGFERANEDGKPVKKAPAAKKAAAKKPAAKKAAEVKNDEPETSDSNDEPDAPKTEK